MTEPVNNTADAQDVPKDEVSSAELLIEKARDAVEKSELQGSADANILDNNRTPEDRHALIENLVRNALYLDEAMLEDGRKFVDCIWLENNAIDKQLIDLKLVIVDDNFDLQGTYDLAILDGILSDIVQKLPEKLLNSDIDHHADERHKIEQRLVAKNLSQKLILGTDTKDDDSIPATELTAELSDLIVTSNNPDDNKSKGLHNILDHIK
jgi:hypothetical protein